MKNSSVVLELLHARKYGEAMNNKHIFASFCFESTKHTHKKNRVYMEKRVRKEYPKLLYRDKQKGIKISRKSGGKKGEMILFFIK
jgi:hypothetical protein